MQIQTLIDPLKQQLKLWRLKGDKIAFVPTMGNLHAGHLELVQMARMHADRVVVSIFVNPTQFGPNEDYASYPRTEQQDQQKLKASAVDLLFMPAVTEMYPQPLQTSVSVKGLSTMLCGASRPGHFDGVALVVCKLLNIVQPDELLLGEKDFQQLAVIRQMLIDLNLPVNVRGVPTVREYDGLAMSSRNGYLTIVERRIAPKLYQTLCVVKDEILAGNLDFEVLLAQKSTALQQAGFVIDYFQVCRSADLLPATFADDGLVVLIAAKLGKTRLIDNVYFVRSSH